MTLLILLMWAISIVTNILNPIGMISFCFLLGEGDLDFTLPLIIGGIGFVYMGIYRTATLIVLDRKSLRSIRNATWLRHR